MKITFISSTVDFSRTLNVRSTTAENNEKKMYTRILGSDTDYRSWWPLLFLFDERKIL